jgi:branched-chain amino acid transport system ATP-binding protein
VTAETRAERPLLTVDDLSVRYGAIFGVRSVSLEVREGELVSLVGANGAGKSTTLGAIAGIRPVTRGSITFGGRPITNLAPERIARAGIAMVPENRGIFPGLTVGENLRLGAYLRRDADGTRTDLTGIHERFPILRERRDQGAGTLSGGEQQQLAIARALLSRPKLLMLDEPSLGLAPALVDAVFDLVAQLHREGTTILLVEQNVRRTLQVVDRAYLLVTGRVEASGTPSELQELVDIESAYLGGRSRQQPAPQPPAR